MLEQPERSGVGPLQIFYAQNKTTIARNIDNSLGRSINRAPVPSLMITECRSYHSNGWRDGKDRC